MNDDEIVKKPVAKLRKFNKVVKKGPVKSNLTEIDEEIEDDGMEDDENPKPIASLKKFYKVVRKRK